MNRPQPSRGNQRRRSHKRPALVDIWQAPKPLPDYEPIVAAPEVGVVLRSLGDPPMRGGVAAGHYFNAVVQRAAAVAIALSLSADVLASPED